MKINKKLIKELVDSLEEYKLSELEYSEKDIKIKDDAQKLEASRLLKKDEELILIRM